MNKWFRILFLCLIMFVSVVSAEDLVPGQAYIISSINVDSSELITANQKYSLVPQVVVYDGTTEYVGSVTKFTGCYGTRRYVDGVDKGECFLGGNATTSAAGLMSASDKAKLDGINLSNYALASHTHDDRYYTESEIDTKFSNLNVSSNYINSLGNKTAETGSTKLSTPGLSMQQVYDNGYPTTFGNVINLNGSGEGQILVGWSGTSGAHAGVYVRSQRDVSDADWSPWAEFITSNNIGSQSVNYANSSNYSNSSGTSNYANRVWTQSHNGSWYINSNWNGSVFVTNARENGGSELPIWVNHAGNADTVDGYHAGDIGKAVLLWVNSSPTSQFNAQTISVNLSGYQFVKIVFYTGGSGFYYTNDFIVQDIPQIGATTVGYNIASWNSTNTIQNVGREISGITSSGVKFGQGYFTVNTYREYNNIFGIPYKIYGIK